MGTIAEKLTYLNTTKEKIKDSINLTGANIGTSDTFRSYASKLKKGYIDIINNGIDTLYNNFPKVSEIGSNLSLTPTYEAPMKLNEIQGDTLQDGTPTPSSPVPIQSVTGLQNIEVCGKNLLPFTNQDFTFKDMHYYVKNGNIYLNGTNAGETGSNNALFKENFSFYLEAGTYTLQDKGLVSGNRDIRKYSDNTVLGRLNPNSKVVSFTLTERTQVYLGFYIYNQTYNNELIEVQLEQGSTATDYKPYKGNTYEVNLGKNLWGISNQTTTKNNVDITIQDGEITLNGTASGDGLIMFNPIDEIILNGDYTLNEIYVSGTYTGNASNINVRKKGTSVNIKSLNYAASNTNTTLNVSNTSIIFGIYLTNGSSFTNFKFKPQLVKGTSADYNFSPYFTPIELNEIGDYQDSIKKSTGKNLFDKSTITANSRLGSDGNPYSDSSYSLSDYIEVEPSTTYSYNRYTSGGGSGAIAYYDSNKTFISRTQPIIGGASNTSGSMTTPSNAKYVRITDLETLVDKMQFEKGSSATDYEPYGKVWYIEKKIGELQLTNSNNINNFSEATNTDYIYIYSKYYDNLIANSYGGYSSHFKNYEDTMNKSTNTNGTAYSYGGNQWAKLRFMVAKSLLNDTSTASAMKTSFNTLLEEKQPVFYYPLATPTYIEITNTELINQLEELYTAKSQEGTTNISITSEDLEMILNVSALKGEE